MPGKHKWKYRGYQEGGPVTKTGIPQGGHAAAPLAGYLGGTTEGAPTINYEAGAIQRELANKMAAAREASSLVEQGVATPEEVNALFQTQVGQGDWDRPVGEGGHPEGGWWLTGDKAGQKVGAFTPTAIDPGSYQYTEAGLPGGTGKALDALAGWSVDRQNKLAAKGNAKQYRSPQGHLVTVHRGLGGGLVVSGQTGGVDPSVYIDAAQKDGLRAGGIVGKAASKAAAIVNPPTNTYSQEDDGGGIAGYEGGQSYTWEDVAQDTIDAYSDSGDDQLDQGIHEDDYSWDFNVGGPVMADDDIWGADPLASSQVGTPDLGQLELVQAQVEEQGPSALRQAAGVAAPLAIDYALEGTVPGGSTLLKAGLPFLGLNAGGWVGKRTRYLVDGGMAQGPAEMQAYDEMQSMTGPEPVGADYMMPQGSPMPDQMNTQDFGYVPSGGMSYKEQMEADKVYIQREKAVSDDERKNRSFDMAEKRKDDMHKLAMQQKQESHGESMRQKRAGPLDKQGG